VGAIEVASFGQNLRQAREARNITLQEIAAATKIGSRALQALEDERFELLPGGIFNKGFVRAYARFVGLDEEKTVAAYMEAAKVAAPETDLQAMATQVTAIRAAADEQWQVSAATVVGVLAVIVALGLGALWLRGQQKESRERAAARQQAESAMVSAAAPAAVTPPSTVAAVDPSAATGAVGTTDVKASDVRASDVKPSDGVPDVKPSATSEVKPEAKPNGASDVKPGSSLAPVAALSKDAAAPVEISISATARTWISVRSDGNKAESVTLDPEKPELRTRSYKAREKLVLMVGNPAGLSVTYNGKPVGALGAAGQRVTITFTPQGMEKQ
jgi:cytoskeleton protein RodZ